MSPAIAIPPLAGVTVWLSGAVPEPESWDGRPLDVEVLDFVALLTALVLKQGGGVLHGAHPSFTAVLLEQARRARDQGLGRDRVTLAVSKFWEKDTAADIREWKPFCRVIETEAGRDQNNEPAREPSLAILRARMASEAHAFVAVGGKWWSDQPGRAGVPREFELACERGLPCFLIGGFGGKSAGYLSEHPKVFETLNNRLSPEENRQLAACADLGLVAGAVVARLCALFGLADASENPSAIPAHALHVELATRITTQRLHYRSGDEETAATSIHSLFKTTRELMTQHPTAREFHDSAFALLNDALRPYTARWHGWMTQDGDKFDAENKPIRRFRDEWVRRKFREELRELQPRLLGFQKHFRSLSRGEQADSRWLHVDQHVELRKQFTAECQTGPGDARLGSPLLLEMRPQITLSRAGKAGREERSDMGEEIARWERLAILQRRVQLREGEARADAEMQLRSETPVVTDAIGLALSGGGIRSATFCLGVVQALHRRKLFAQFDYLSTVSGGGYLGSFLSSLLVWIPGNSKKRKKRWRRIARPT